MWWRPHSTPVGSRETESDKRCAYEDQTSDQEKPLVIWRKH